MWSNIVNDFILHVKSGNICEGYMVAIDKIEEQLRIHFPANNMDKNELPNHLIEAGIPE